MLTPHPEKCQFCKTERACRSLPLCAVKWLFNTMTNVICNTRELSASPIIGGDPENIKSNITRSFSEKVSAGCNFFLRKRIPERCVKVFKKGRKVCIS